MKKLRKARRQIMVFRWAFPSETFYFAILFAACILSIWILIGRVAFETYSTWDDEGYFILLLSHFLKVGGLYVKTYSQYGPFFTLMESSLHRLFDLPVDLDGGRILTVSYILGGALLLSFFVGHLTRRLALALPCFVLSVMITAPILDEPGHPQGLIAALVSIALCLSLLVGTSYETLSFVVLGALAAALSLTKINVGLFFCFSLGFPLILMLVKSRFRSLLLGLFIAGSICTPPVLMLAYLWEWAATFCLYMLLSFVALYVAALQSRVPNVLKPIRIAYLVFGFVVAAIPILVWGRLTGSPLSALFSGILIRPLGQARLFFIPKTIPALLLILLLLFVGGLSAITVARRKFRNVDIWLALCKVAIALICGGFFMWRPDGAMFYSLPVLPLLLLAPGGVWIGVRGVFPRLFLVSLIEFEMLQSYPVLGSSHHDALTASGAWICLLLYDGWSALAALYPKMLPRFFVGSRGALRGFCILLTVPVLSWYIGISPAHVGGLVLHHRQNIMRWLKGQPLPPPYPLLDLPGARLLHVPTTEAFVYRRLAEELHANCDMLFTMPGMGSLNVWSETPPPNGFNLTAWMGGLTEEEQRAIKIKLEDADRPCIVYNPGLTQSWILPGVHLDPEAPMVHFVLREAKTVFAAGPYQVRVPYTRRAPWKTTTPSIFLK